MGRRPREYQPGGIFHLTARTLRYERRFSPRLRTAALGAIADAVPWSGSRLLAAAVMPHHLHLVVQQGERPLSALMQPLLRRLALQLQEAHGLQGPVFWRSYASRACLDPTHARNAIVYTHLNPVRANICRHPSEYDWTSHQVYSGGSAAALPVGVERLAKVLDPSVALPLFATGDDRSDAGLRTGYRAFLSWRLDLDRAEEGLGEREGDAETGEAKTWPNPPWAGVGPGWSHSLSPLFHSPMRPGSQDPGALSPPAAVDLATLARSMLDAAAPGVSLACLRGRGGGRERSRLRHLLIRRLHSAGFRNVEIARFLSLSDSAVSYAIRRPGRGGPGSNRTAG